MTAHNNNNDKQSEISVMLIDDSSIIRSLLREVLKQDPQINVVAHAINGKLALPRIRYYKPQIIILDYEMPEMNGIETLKVIKKDYPESKVIMFSTFTVEGARITIEALDLGAADFLPKPEFSKDADPREYIRDHLIPKIKALGRSGLLLKKKPDPATKQQTQSAVSTRPVQRSANEADSTLYSGKFDICAIGISTGGPIALRQLLSQIPSNIKGSLVITQHMPPLFTAQLAESLNKQSALKVVEGRESMVLEKAAAYIAPGGKHMLITKSDQDKRIKLDYSPPYLLCRPSVNLMFRSLALSNPKKTMAVIMTGMGSDGYEAMIELKKAGAYLIAQNKESCLVYGMPAKATEENLVTETLDISQIAERITFLLGGK